MILGMSIPVFTLLHVLISLGGIFTGFVVLFGMIRNRKEHLWTLLFFVTNILTDVTGFMFPFKAVTPGIIIGALSLIVLVIAMIALYGARLSGGWRGRYVIAAAVALYFNVFVLVVQSFEKISVLNAIAPTQASPVFGITQLVVMVLMILLTVLAFRRFRPAQLSVSPPVAK